MYFCRKKAYWRRISKPFLPSPSMNISETLRSTTVIRLHGFRYHREGAHRGRNSQIESNSSARLRRIGLIREARLNRERMPIWNYSRRAGITGSCRLGLQLRFCLTCLTRDKNVIQHGTGHRRGGTRTRTSTVAFLPSSPTTTPRRATWER